MSFRFQCFVHGQRILISLFTDGMKYVSISRILRLGKTHVKQGYVYCLHVYIYKRLIYLIGVY